MNCAFTICAKNYSAQALTLRESFLKHNPSLNFFIFLADKIDGVEDVDGVVALDKSWILDWVNMAYKLAVWYKKAKEFALPSTNEGVGMVALEAADYGCEIVLTNLGAPKEYFDGMARLVNPYSIDDIGYAMRKTLTEGFSQPELLRFFARHYSLESCSNLLIDVLK